MDGRTYCTAVAGLNSNAIRTVRGAISFNNSAQGARRVVGHEAGDVTARMRMVRSEAAGDRIRYAREHDRNCLRLAGKGADYGRGHTKDRIGPQIDQLVCQSPHPIRIIGAPAKFDPEIAAFGPPQLRECTSERG